MRILVVGGGAREHALVTALAGDDRRHHLYAAPGNPGTATLATNIASAADDIDRLADAADAYAIDLVMVGPELPLALGLADRLREEGRTVFGPGAAGARIEASKAFAKEVMLAAGVPTAASRTCTSLADALAHVEHHAEPLVVKASGLAAGKGAVVCSTRDDARAALRSIMGERTFGSAGDVVVIEEFLPGEELSVMAITNGRDVTLLPAAQDHKRLFDGDRGPNTGGMGAYAPVSLATPDVMRRIEDTVIRPTLAELARRGAPYRGVLYAGIMLHPDGTPNVVEFNCRLGDPEAEVLLPLLRSGLTDVLDAAARGEPLPALELRSASAVTTVLAAPGYPDAPVRGALIMVGDVPDGVTVYHAGTVRDADGVLRVHGGRVFAVTAVAGDFASAQAASVRAAGAIEFAGKQWRGDIGWREAERLARGR